MAISQISTKNKYRLTSVGLKIAVWRSEIQPMRLYRLNLRTNMNIFFTYVLDSKITISGAVQRTDSCCEDGCHTKTLKTLTHWLKFKNETKLNHYTCSNMHVLEIKKKHWYFNFWYIFVELWISQFNSIRSNFSLFMDILFMFAFEVKIFKMFWKLWCNRNSWKSLSHKKHFQWE